LRDPDSNRGHHDFSRAIAPLERRSKPCHYANL
jgi:hypothetical protein